MKLSPTSSLLLTLTVALALALATSLPAQTRDTLGGTTAAPSGANRGQANLIRVDSTRVLTDLEMYLDVPGAETLVWFVYRHHSRDGVGPLMWTKSTPVNGSGLGATWYSSGPIAVGLVEGNHYLIGVA